VCVKKYHRVSEPFSKERKDVHLLRRLRVLLISITPSGFIKFDAKYFFIIIAFEFTHINNETANLKKKRASFDSSFFRPAAILRLWQIGSNFCSSSPHPAKTNKKKKRRDSDNDHRFVIIAFP